MKVYSIFIYLFLSSTIIFVLIRLLKQKKGDKSKSIDPDFKNVGSGPRDPVKPLSVASETIVLPQREILDEAKRIAEGGNDDSD